MPLFLPRVHNPDHPHSQVRVLVLVLDLERALVLELEPELELELELDRIQLVPCRKACMRLDLAAGGSGRATDWQTLRWYHGTCKL